MKTTPIQELWAQANLPWSADRRSVVSAAHVHEDIICDIGLRKSHQALLLHSVNGLKQAIEELKECYKHLGGYSCGPRLKEIIHNLENVKID